MTEEQYLESIMIKEIIYDRSCFIVDSIVKITVGNPVDDSRVQGCYVNVYKTDN